VSGTLAGRDGGFPDVKDLFAGNPEPWGDPSGALPPLSQASWGENFLCLIFLPGQQGSFSTLSPWWAVFFGFLEGNLPLDLDQSPAEETG
jgi:hypothetical protein